MKHPTKVSLAAVALGMGMAAIATSVHASMFDFMNPGRWFDSDRDRYYGPGRYGHGPYGYGGGPYGYGGGPYGWGGGGPHGWGGYPGSTIVVTPQGSSGGQQAPAPRLPE